jgi:hypothetical protein
MSFRPSKLLGSKTFTAQDLPARSDLRSEIERLFAMFGTRRLLGQLAAGTLFMRPRAQERQTAGALELQRLLCAFP